MFGDLFFGEGPGIDGGDGGFDDFCVVGEADQGEAGYDFVRGAEEHSDDAFGVGGVYGFADDLAVEVDDGVGSEDKSVGVSSSDVFGLGECELASVFDGVEAGGGVVGFIDFGGDDVEDIAVLFEEEFASGGGGGEYERGSGVCVVHCSCASVMESVIFWQKPRYSAST